MINLLFSAGVRMSLAETRLVNETRAFLERNGVVLDAFSRPDVQRSGTVIIAKNLPAGIDDNELKQKFEKYGEVKRFLLPPGKHCNCCSRFNSIFRMQSHSFD